MSNSPYGTLTLLLQHFLYCCFQDTISVNPSYMKYDFSDSNCDIPPLEDFLHQLANQVLRSSFFHNEPKDQINMLKLPIIMPKSLVGLMVNKDSEKKSLMNTEKQYKKNIVENFMNMVASGRVDFLNFEKLDEAELTEFARELEIPNISKKSNVYLREEIKNVGKIFLAGQGKLDLKTTCFEITLHHIKSDKIKLRYGPLSFY